TILHSLGGRTVVRVDNGLVVKSGHIRPHEAETLRFIANNTMIPFMISAGRITEDDQVIAIMMDYVPGKRLDEAWDTLDSDQKLAIADQLHPYNNQLRA
ncbi:hypothetical protein N7522_002809, partial [Penicillium canescens]